MYYLIVRKINIEKFKFKEQYRGGNRDKEGREGKRESLKSESEGEQRAEYCTGIHAGLLSGPARGWIYMVRGGRKEN